MKNFYLTPSRTLLPKDKGHICLFAQYSFDFSQCPGAEPSSHNQILTVIDSETIQLEACLGSHGVNNGEVLATLQCLETGNKVYSETIISSQPGTHLTCDISEPNDTLILINFSPAIPSTCTITQAVFGDQGDICQL